MRVKILSLLPFVIPLVISLGAVAGLFPVNPNFSPRLPIIFSVIFAFLVGVVLWRCATPTLQLPVENSKVDKRLYSRAQGTMLVVSSLIGATFGFVLLDPSRIRHAAGILFTTLGLLAILLRLAFPAVRNIGTVEGRQEEPFKSNFVADFYKKQKFMVAQISVTLIALVAFAIFGGEKYFSYWDIFGFLVFSVGLGIWFFPVRVSSE